PASLSSFHKYQRTYLTSFLFLQPLLHMLHVPYVLLAIKTLMNEGMDGLFFPNVQRYSTDYKALEGHDRNGYCLNNSRKTMLQTLVGHKYAHLTLLHHRG